MMNTTQLLTQLLTLLQPQREMAQGILVLLKQGLLSDSQIEEIITQIESVLGSVTLQLDTNKKTKIQTLLNHIHQQESQENSADDLLISIGQ